VRDALLFLFLPTLLALCAASPALADVEGDLLDDLHLVRERWEEAVQLWRAGEVGVVIVPSSAPGVCYLPDGDPPFVGPVGGVEFKPGGVLVVRTPTGTLEYRFRPPILVNDSTVCFSDRLCEVDWMNQEGRPSVGVEDLRTGAQTAYTAPFRVTDFLPGPLELANVEYHLAPDRCTLTYYIISRRIHDRYLELTVRIPREGEPEFHARVVYDPQRVLELRRTLKEKEEIERTTGGSGWCVVHTLEGARLVWLGFRPPEDAPLTRFLDRARRLCGEFERWWSVLDVSALDLLAWWLEWKLRWPNVRLVPGETDWERRCYYLLTQAWPAIVPDLLAAASSLSIILPLVHFEHWWFEKLEPVSEKLRALGPLGQFLVAVAYYTPVGLLEGFLGELVLPLLIRVAVAPIETLLPWIGRLDASALALRALFCTVAPVVDTLAMQRVAKLTGSPVLAALTFALLDRLWVVRSQWFNPSFWLSRALPFTEIVLASGARALPCAVLPPSLAVLLYALQNSGIILLPWPEVNLDAENQHCLLHALLTPLLERITERIAPV